MHFGRVAELSEIMVMQDSEDEEMHCAQVELSVVVKVRVVVLVLRSTTNNDRVTRRETGLQSNC